MWLAIVGKRCAQGTTALTRSPTAKPSPRKVSTWSSPTRVARSSSARARVCSFSIQPGVGHLAAALGVERRLVELRIEEAVVARLEGRDRRQHLGLLVADKLRRPLADEPHLEGARGAGALALLLHPPRELLLVDRQPALVRQLAGELVREAVRVVEPEGVLARDRVAARGDLLEQSQAARQRPGEALLLGSEDARDLVAVLGELRDRRRPSARRRRRRGARGRASRARCDRPAARRGGRCGA